MCSLAVWSGAGLYCEVEAKKKEFFDASLSHSTLARQDDTARTGADWHTHRLTKGHHTWSLREFGGRRGRHGWVGDG